MRPPMSASASSQLTCSHRPSPRFPIRRIGCRIRSVSLIWLMVARALGAVATPAGRMQRVALELHDLAGRLVDPRDEATAVGLAVEAGRRDEGEVPLGPAASPWHRGRPRRPRSMDRGRRRAPRRAGGERQRRSFEAPQESGTDCPADERPRRRRDRPRRPARRRRPGRSGRRRPGPGSSGQRARPRRPRRRGGSPAGERAPGHRRDRQLDVADIPGPSSTAISPPVPSTPPSSAHRTASGRGPSRTRRRG